MRHANRQTDRRDRLPGEVLGIKNDHVAEIFPLLVAHFVRRFAERQGKCIDEIPDSVIETLRNYTWPGNVRELQNMMERAVIATTGRTLQTLSAVGMGRQRGWGCPGRP